MNKQTGELEFWKGNLKKLERWYSCDPAVPELYGEGHPGSAEKITGNSLKDNAILTWNNVHQKTKYLKDLMLDKNAFTSKVILDLGSGPIPSATAFQDCDIYCLDPLIADYIKIGYPTHYYDRTRFICASAEDIPIADNFFDAVLSVNAIDHVDDLWKTAEEVRRVLKPGGLLRIHAHYHKAKILEPIEITDEVMNDAFKWCGVFKKDPGIQSKTRFCLK